MKDLLKTRATGPQDGVPQLGAQPQTIRLLPDITPIGEPSLNSLKRQALAVLQQIEALEAHVKARNFLPDRSFPRFYEFGPFRLSTRERLLLCGGKLVPLSPKVIDTLFLLIENRGHLVAKDYLMDRLWPDVFVQESSLTQNISLLRRALRHANEPLELIETIPKRGYRFVAAVREVDETNCIVLPP